MIVLSPDDPSTRDLLLRGEVHNLARIHPSRLRATPTSRIAPRVHTLMMNNLRQSHQALVPSLLPAAEDVLPRVPGLDLRLSTLERTAVGLQDIS